VHTNGRSVGLIVDSAREFAAIDGAAIQPPGSALSATSGRYLEGVANLGDRLILVLDLPAVLTFSESEVPAA
jgi:chemotaxis signal transduction protein